MDIYALGDPRTGQIRYIGIAKNVFRRYGQHLNGNAEWIEDIKSVGMIPTFTILERCVNNANIHERERHWIEYYLALGAKLTNIHYVPPSVTFNTPDHFDYIPAQEAAHMLSLKTGRTIDPCRINKLRNIRHIKINKTTHWYHKGDIEAYKIGTRRTRCKHCRSFDCPGHNVA